MSTLKVNKLRDTAGSTDAITLDPNGGAVLAGVTTVTSVKVGAAVTISESGIEATGVGITCANINGTHIGGRNLIINGDMRIAQRATSSTSTTAGYATVDRFRYAIGGQDEAATHAQVDVASGTDPYKLGFRKAFKVTNGNQTSGAGSSDYIQIDYYVEAQDVANSGWDITNPNSFLTFSFWIKSSVSQFFTFAIRCKDGTEQVINFKTPVLSADTWTKVIKRIPGNANLTVNNDNGQGLQFMFFPFIGTNYSTVGLAEDTWSSWASAKHAIPNTSTWWTTNDSTWEITGLQLEVGTQATPFEHRSYGDELALCQRYYYKMSTDGSTTVHLGTCQYYSDNDYFGNIKDLPVEMRAIPTGTFSGNGKPWTSGGNSNGNFTSITLNKNSTTSLATNGSSSDGSGGTAGHATVITMLQSSSLEADAEL